MNIIKLPRYKWIHLIANVLLTLLGISALIFPHHILSGLKYVFGLGLLIVGLSTLYEFIAVKSQTRDRIFPLIGGVGYLAGALIVFFLPLSFLQSGLGIVFSSILILTGIVTISHGLLEKPFDPSYLFRILVGVIFVLGGIMLFGQLEHAGDKIVSAAGVVVIYVGLSRLFTVFLYKEKATPDNEVVDIDYTKK